MGRSGGRRHLGKNTNITTIARPRPQKTTSVDVIGCQHDHDDDGDDEDDEDDDDDADNFNDIDKDNGDESDTDTKINTAGACNNLGRSDEGASNPKHEGNWRPTHCRGYWQQFCADICRRACGGLRGHRLPRQRVTLELPFRAWVSNSFVPPFEIAARTSSFEPCILCPAPGLTLIVFKDVFRWWRMPTTNISTITTSTTNTTVGVWGCRAGGDRAWSFSIWDLGCWALAFGGLRL